MTKSSFLMRHLGDSRKVRILDFLMDNFASDFSLKQIAKESKVAYTTLIGLLPELMKQGLLLETRKVGKTKLFAINIDNPIVSSLYVLDFKLSEKGGEK